MTAEMWDNSSEAARCGNTGRPLTRSSDLTREGMAMKATRTCSVEGCQKPGKGSKTLCSAHESRLRRTGNVGPPEVWDKKRKPCAVDGCETLAKAYGFCPTHRSRFDRYGDPLADVPIGYKPPLTYSGLHQFLGRVLGSVRAQDCTDCGGVAAEWAYDNLDPDEVVVPDHGLLRRFSRNSAHYMPMCIKCHRNFDLRHRQLQDAP